MMTTLLAGLGAALTTIATSDARVGAHYVAALEALYAADAGIERALSDLALTADWTAIAAGDMPSTFVDGNPGGLRAAGDGTPLDLTVATNLERCGRVSACGDAEATIPWRLYAHAPIDLLLPPGTTGPSVYVVVWAAAAPDAGTNGLVLRARAYGAYGTRRAVEAFVAPGAAGPRVLSWREL